MTENGSQMYMPVAPAYGAGGGMGGFGYGSDWWLIIIILFAFGGWGNGGFILKEIKSDYSLKD